MLVCPEKSKPDENKNKTMLGYTCMVDTWAIGILAFELVGGRPPFERETRAETYEHIMYRRPAFGPAMSEGLRHFVNLALTKVILLSIRLCSALGSHGFCHDACLKASWPGCLLLRRELQSCNRRH